MQLEQQQLGSLNCQTVRASEAPDHLVVLCHGYGAPGDDLVPIGGELMRLLGDAGPRCLFVFPQAPLTLAEMGMPDGRAWWPLNMERLMAAVEADDFSELRSHTPPGLSDARAMLTETIDAAARKFDIAAGNVVLGGFSQGAMLTLDTALRGVPEVPRGIIQWSGTLICEADWLAAATRLAGVPLVQSHGTADPILPFHAAEALRDLLQQAGAELQFVPFPGPHTITMDALSATGDMLQAILKKAS